MAKPILRRGSQGDAVRELQEALIRHGVDPGPIDGIFGPRTEAAVRSSQTSRGLTIDGIVGPQTWAALCLPEFDPSRWNDGGSVQRNNNCFNYACDVQSGTFAQPGTASGHPFTNTNCAEVGAGALSDGLVSASCDDAECADCCHQAALVTWPGIDFHWFRRDRSGKWSHKPGQTRARDVDNSGNPITDPRAADRGPYVDFCGCFCVCKGKIAAI